LVGLSKAYHNDKSIRIEIWSGFILVVIGYFLWPMSPIEILFLALGYALILIAELLNTALELALERLHPGHNKVIGDAKDIASAAVFIAIIFMFIIMGVLTLTRLGIF